MTVTLIILLLTVAGFVVGRPRADIVALTALMTLVVTGILTPEEALSGFSGPVVVMMAGLFVVGSAILQTGIAKAASRSILRLHGGELSARRTGDGTAFDLRLPLAQNAGQRPPRNA